MSPYLFLPEYSICHLNRLKRTLYCEDTKIGKKDDFGVSISYFAAKKSTSFFKFIVESNNRWVYHGFGSDGDTPKTDDRGGAWSLDGFSCLP